MLDGIGLVDLVRVDFGGVFGGVGLEYVGGEGVGMGMSGSGVGSFYHALLMGVNNFNKLLQRKVRILYDPIAYFLCR